MESPLAEFGQGYDAKLTVMSDNSTNQTSSENETSSDETASGNDTVPSGAPSASSEAVVEAETITEPSNSTASLNASETASVAPEENVTPAGGTEAPASVSASNVTDSAEASPPNATSTVAAPEINASDDANVTEEGIAAENITAVNATAVNATAVNALAVPDPLNVTSNATAGNLTSVAVNATANVTAENVTTENITAENVTANVTTAASEVEVPEEEAVSGPAPEEEAEPESSEEEEATGDRIWSETRDSPQDFTWTPMTFAGFFYDMDDQVGTEKLTVHLTKSGSGYGRSVGEGNLKYSTTVQPIRYEFSDWGSYQVLGFMADKYFGGYEGTDPGVADNDISLINENQLRKVLIDSDDSRSITTGSVLQLANGYELRIKEIDTNGNKVWLAVARDGEEIDSKVVQPEDIRSSTYAYKEDIGGSKDTPLILAHVSNVFTSAESSLVTIDGLFQIADDYLSVNDGDKYGKMKVSSVYEGGIEMENEDSFSLQKGRVVSLMGNVSFIVADDNVLRFAPQVIRTGSYDVRGTVVDPELYDEFTWTPYNFEGFYYDIDDDVGTEKLTARFTGSRIDDGDLTYETTPQAVDFEFEPWGRYDVVGFMADKYFAGYNNATEFTDIFSLINEGQLRKVLIDSDTEETLTTGSVLPLQEGYELRIKEVDINGNKVWIAIARDGEELDSLVVSPSAGETRVSTFMYKVTVGSETNVPILAAHINNVFRGTEADLATIDGIFQISDTAESVESGEMFDKMKLDSVSDQGITAVNDGAISLGRGRNIDIMGNIKFQIADSSTRTLAPVARRVGENVRLSLNIPEAAVNKVVRISVQSSGEAIAGANLVIDSQSLGVTGPDGTIDYTPSLAGTYPVKASKEGYISANATMVVGEVLRSELLTINVPGEVLKGESFLITVNGGSNQTAMDGVSLSFDGAAIGITDRQGSLTYASNATGEHTIRATKNGYEPSTRNITVASAIELSSLKVPEEASAGRNMDILAVVENRGPMSDSKTLELKVNGQTVATEEVSLESGENRTVEFQYKPEEPGVYRFDVEDKSTTVTVEKASSNAALIAVILILIIVVGAGFYLYRTGELDKLRGRIKR